MANTNDIITTLRREVWTLSSENATLQGRVEDLTKQLKTRADELAGLRQKEEEWKALTETMGQLIETMSRAIAKQDEELADRTRLLTIQNDVVTMLHNALHGTGPAPGPSPKGADWESPWRVSPHTATTMPLKGFGSQPVDISPSPYMEVPSQASDGVQVTTAQPEGTS